MFVAPFLISGRKATREKHSDYNALEYFRTRTNKYERKRIEQDQLFSSVFDSLHIYAFLCCHICCSLLVAYRIN